MPRNIPFSSTGLFTWASAICTSAASPSPDYYVVDNKHRFVHNEIVQKRANWLGITGIGMCLIFILIFLLIVYSNFPSQIPWIVATRKWYLENITLRMRRVYGIQTDQNGIAGINVMGIDSTVTPPDYMYQFSGKFKNFWSEGSIVYLEDTSGQKYGFLLPFHRDKAGDENATIEYLSYNQDRQLISRQYLVHMNQDDALDEFMGNYKIIISWNDPQLLKDLVRVAKLNYGLISRHPGKITQIIIDKIED